MIEPSEMTMGLDETWNYCQVGRGKFDMRTDSSNDFLGRTEAMKDWQLNIQAEEIKQGCSEKKGYDYNDIFRLNKRIVSRLVGEVFLAFVLPITYWSLLISCYSNNINMS